MRCRMHSTYRLTCPTCSRLNRENYDRGRSSGRVTGAYNVSNDYVFLTVTTGDNSSSVPDGGGGASVDFGITYSSNDGGSSSSYSPSTDSTSYDGGF